jgi:hypothetical protein
MIINIEQIKQIAREVAKCVSKQEAAIKAAEVPQKEVEENEL